MHGDVAKTVDPWSMDPGGVVVHAALSHLLRFLTHPSAVAHVDATCMGRTTRR